MKKVTKSISWALFDQLLQFVAQFANMIILSRILSPKDFGIFAIGSIVISIVQQVFAMGLTPALIQMDNHEAYYPTAWTANLVITFLITILLIFTFPFLVSYFYGAYDEYVVYFQILSITVLFTGLNNIGTVELFKSYNIKRLIYIRGLSSILRVLIVIVLFLFFHDFRALVYGFVFISFIKLILSYIIAPNKSKIGFNLKMFKTLYSFGGWLQLKNVVKTISYQVDSLTLGALLSPATLGYYNRAIIFSRTQETIIANFNDLFTFPFLSAKKKDKDYFEKKFVFNYTVILALVFLISLVINCYGKQIVFLFLGQRWIEILPPLQILVVAFGLGALLISFFPFLRALGYPKIEFKLYLIKLLSLTIIVYPMIISYGMLGAAGANLISTLISIPFFIYFTRNYVKIDVKQFLFTFLIYFLVGIVFLLIFPLGSSNYFLVFLEIIFMTILFLVLSTAIIIWLLPQSYYVISISRFLKNFLKY